MKRLFATTLLMMGIALVPATAQTGTGAAAASAAEDRTHTSMARDTERNDNDFNLGWLGLLGLAGLIPRKQRVVHADHVTDNRTGMDRH